MELYAGTRDQTDKRELDRMEQILSRINRIITPQTRDFYLAGQMTKLLFFCEKRKVPC
jgi:hypothetical protein